jgi:hypothetical protein
VANARAATNSTVQSLYVFASSLRASQRWTRTNVVGRAALLMIDGVYVVDINGEPVVRFVQDRGGGRLYVYCLSLMDQGQSLPCEAVSILAAAKAVTKTRRIA